MLKPVNPKQNFPELEKDVLKFWKKNKIFQKQVEQKPEDNKYVFYDGPPFITGLPHYGHLLGSISKDLIPRYQAMKGKRVERVWGWDCHGLPIENKVEKELGLKNRRDIEKLGVDKFVEHCYRYTRETSAEWDWYIDRIGRWVDVDKAYKTMDQDYMETVMWVFKQLHDKDLIYTGTRTSLFCTRCGTPVSNFEIAMDNSYTDMDDPAVTVKFKIQDTSNKIQTNSKSQNSNPKIFLISGKHACASREYYPELKKELESKGFEVEIIDHIDPASPNYQENIKNLEKYNFENSTVITHSLGGSTFMSYLSNNDVEIANLIMIAPPYDELSSTNPKWAEESGYSQAVQSLDLDKIKTSTKEISIIYSDDELFKEESFKSLAKRLNAKIIKEENKKHFFGKEYSNNPESLMDIISTYDSLSTTPSYMLAWTTTPWTLPSNRGLVVDPEGDYVKVKRSVKLEDRKGATAVIYNPKKNKFLVLDWERDRVLGMKALVQGGQEEGETLEETVLREITEETGYTDHKVVKKLGINKYQWPHKGNKINNREYDVFLVELENEKQQKRQLEEGEKFDVEWVDYDKFIETVTYDSHIVFAKKAIAHYEGKDNGEEIDFEEKEITNSDFEEYLILGKNRLEETLEGFEYEIVEEFKGKELVGLEYEPHYPFIPANEKDFKVYSYEGMVDSEEGVGIVHSAPGFGEVDSEMGKHHGLTMMLTVNDEGKFISEIEDFAGMYYKDANKYIVTDLVQRNIILKIEQITHRFPYCYRCETPLIQKAQPSWYIDVQKIKGDLIKNNENINWVPEHIKEGRFKKGLETAPDWGISRSRYWGTPMPVWQAIDEDGKVTEQVVIGSRDDLMERNDEITKIIFVRHGDIGTDGSKEDVSISELGEKQAKAIAEKYKGIEIDAILSSSMQRCQDTITPIAKELGMDIIIDERFGSNKRKEDLYKAKDVAGVKKLKDTPDSLVDKLFTKFIEDDTKTLEEIYKEYKGKTIIVATHGELIASMRHVLEGGHILSYFKNMPERGDDFTTYLYEGKLLDLHRPVIDNIVLKSDNGNKLKRIPETLDVWMESASMPYAQKHYPFDNKEDVESNFPADYISEYIAQTRAWFYVMHVISTALWNKNSFNNVVVSGVIMGNDGRKMSKSFGNYPDPKGVIEQYGGDSLRMYLLSTPLLKGENVDIDENNIKGKTREFVLPLWNSYSFLLTYIEMHNWNPEGFEKLSSENTLDKWIVAKLNELTNSLTTRLDNYDIPGATNLLPEFLMDLSKWYIRRSRDRFRDGDSDAIGTLYYVIFEFIKLISPFTPFVAEGIYRNLANLETQPESIHLTDYPETDIDLLKSSEELLKQMQSVRDISSMGQSVRVENGIKVRQPLSKAEVFFGNDIKPEEWMNIIVQEELNVREVIDTENQTTTEGFLMSENTSTNAKITLDSNLTQELKEEGIIREITRNIQSLRKRSGLKFGELVDMKISTNEKELSDIFENKKEEIQEAVNASSIELVDAVGEEGKDVKVNGMVIKVEIG